MADIELVIKISEEKYQGIINMTEEILDASTFCSPRYLYKAVLDGTPLPKEHGRLIDADKTISEICGSSCGCHLEECGYDNSCYSVARISSASTIIEADKEDSENDRL